MRNSLLIGLILSVFYSCSSSKKVQNSYYLSSPYGHEYLLSKQDSIYIKSKQIHDSLFLKQAKKERLKFDFTNQWHPLELTSGDKNFNEIFTNHFKTSTILKPAKSTIIITVGRDGLLKNYEIINNKDNKLKSQLGKVLKNNLIKYRWKAAKVYGFSVDSKVKIDIKIE